jgi:flagellar biosynthesis protein FlhG
LRIYAVTSGKGGVGKTNLSANLAIQFAKLGNRVLVFDADIGLANLDVVLGVPSALKLQHALSHEKRLRDVVQKGPGGIDFIAGGSGLESVVRLDGPTGDQFLRDLNELGASYDILVFDTGAGIDQNVLTFVGAADEILLVATPDPASLTDAYATAKAIFLTKPGAQVQVVMNMVTDETQARATYAKLTSVTQQFLGQALKYAGHVRLDMSAIALIRERKPFSLANPDLVASRDVAAVAARLMGQEPARVAEASAEVGLGDRLMSLFGWKKRSA